MPSQRPDAKQSVRAWHHALNAGDLNQLLALSDDEIEVGGPRGAGRGHRLLGEWFGRAGIRFDPIRMLAHGDTVVVEQDAQWAADAQPHRLASVFRVRDGKIVSVIRYPDLVAALRAAGLDAS